jgi:acyl-CoA thioesterase-1
MKKAGLLYVAMVAVVAAALACANPDTGARSARDSSDIVSAAEPAREDARPVILFVGTSLTAGYGLDPSLAYPALLQDMIDSAGLSYRVLNAGVSGQTSAGTLAGMDWLLRGPVAVLVVETGANDGLRGIDPSELRSNIEQIIQRARRQTPAPAIILTGMEAPPNLGQNYTTAFRNVYRDAAETYDLALVPFLLEGVAGVDSLNQPDGIHPTAAGQRIVADHVWQVLAPLISQ